MDIAMNRRTFVAGAAVSAGVAALMNIGMTRAQAEEAAPADGSVPPFLVAPEPIEPERTVDADVVVVGAGFSGLNCAVSASEEGLNVVILERLPMVIGRGGSTFAINSKLMDEKGYHYTTGTSAPVHDDEKLFDIGRVFKRMMGYHSYRIDGAKWMLHAHKSEEAMNWMIDKMTTASKVGGYDLTPVMEHWYHDPEGINGEFPGTHEFLYGPNGSGPAANPQQDVCENLAAYCEAQGCPVQYNTEAKQLVKDADGRVIGVIAEDEDGTITQYNAAKGVVMATGDFGTDQEMKETLIPWMKDTPAASGPVPATRWPTGRARPSTAPALPARWCSASSGAPSPSRCAPSRASWSTATASATPTRITSSPTAASRSCTRRASTPLPSGTSITPTSPSG